MRCGQVTEQWLAAALGGATQQLRTRAPPEDLPLLSEQDVREAANLAASGIPQNAAAPQNLPGKPHPQRAGPALLCCSLYS